MKVFVFADRLGHELAPLNEHTSIALLPVAGKTVIEHVIEAIAVANITEITLVIASHSEKFKILLTDGRRWGIKIHYLLSRGEEFPSDILKRYQVTEVDEILALRGDILFSPIVSAFLKGTEKLDKDIIYGSIHEKNIAICFTRNKLKGLDKLAWQNIQSTLIKEKTDALLNFEKAKITYLDTFKSYHQANVDAAANQFYELIIPGRNVAQNLRIGRGSKTFPGSIKNGWAFVGASCQIHETAELSDSVIISDHVIVDKNATLRHSIILPYTYIGELTNIENAIVSSNNLIKVDTNTVLRITDSFLLGDLRKSPLNKNLSIAVNSLLGGILLIFSLPFWPIAIASSAFPRPSQMILRVTLRGNRLEMGKKGKFKRRNFSTWYWSTNIPILRYLPLLLSVITGHLRIIGTLPLTPDQAEERTEDWEFLSDKAPAGLLGPTILQVPLNAPIEEKLMSDAFYAQQHSLKKDIVYIIIALKTFFSNRAWININSIN